MDLKTKEPGFLKFFSKLLDPRKQRNRLYSLPDLMSTTIFAVLCGCDNWEEVSAWTEANLHWLNSLGICSRGTPSHDTYNRFFRYLDSKVFQKCFMEWTQSLEEELQGVVPLHEKALKDLGEASSSDVIYIVATFRAENGSIFKPLMTKGQVKEADGMKLIIELLDMKEGVGQ